ncbi:MAG: 5'-nucleotidase C-terminal domain-containing protein, partial [Microbacterium sp.]
MRFRPHPTSRVRRGTTSALAVASIGAAVLVAPSAQAAETVTINLVTINDFHGRIEASSPSGGIAALTTAVNAVRAENPNTIFASAGDNIGASTFTSFIQQDNPTIDTLNLAGLQVSAVGNHEFDQGFADLTDRVIPRADFPYLGANVYEKGTTTPALDEYDVIEVGGVRVGFIGAVTTELTSLVSPAGISTLDIGDIPTALNRVADGLRDGDESNGEADVVIALVHEGASTADAAEAADPTTALGEVVAGADANVDMIVSAHTHVIYNHEIGGRPVIQAGKYGEGFDNSTITYDLSAGALAAPITTTYQPMYDTSVSPALALYESDAEVAPVVAAATAAAETLGSVPLGELAGAFNRAKLADGTTENRGGESTLGNLVAEVQRWATEEPESGAAQIAFMNPGGLRQDMAGTDPGDGSFPRTLTYKQAAVVQPFANTLVNMRLTGAQIKTVLEQQWQRDAYNALPARPFLRLGTSDGFTYAYTQETVTETQLDDPATPDTNEAGLTYEAPEGTVTGMWLDGVPIELDAAYSVTVNAFLAAGGDNFRELAAADAHDTGKIDLSAMVDYMAEFGSSTPLEVDYAQHAVEVEFADDAPAAYEAGATVSFDIRSWTMSTASDVKDTNVDVWLGATKLGSFALDNAIGTVGYDDYGTAAVSVTLPARTANGTATLVLTGAETGTSISVPVTVFTRAASVTVGWPSTFLAKHGKPVAYTAYVVSKGAVPTGTVTVYDGSQAIATATLETADKGAAKIVLPALGRGLHTLRAVYSGDD